MFQPAETIQEIEGAVRRETPSIEGLCRSCSRADTCTFPRDRSRPVWSCDEFEGAEVMPSPSTAPEFSVVTEKAEDVMGLKGLCRQCALRLTCAFPKPLGGVWHCDELA